MISHCPKQNIKYVDECDNSETLLEQQPSNFSLQIPVYFKNMLYKNQYCLQCNEDIINEKEVIFANPNFECQNDTVRDMAANLFENGDYEGFIKLITKHCLFHVTKNFPNTVAYPFIVNILPR